MNTTADRIRAHTDAAVLGRLDERAVAEIERCARSGPQATAERLVELDREWDTDRVVETEAATMGLLTLALGALWRRELLVLPAFVAADLLVHAATGRYSLMPLFRRLGFRTAREIQRERYALKAIRGDYARTDPPFTARRDPAEQVPTADVVQRETH